MRLVRRLWVAPLLAVHRLLAPRAAVERDVQRMLQPRLDLPLGPPPGRGALLDALAAPEFRSLFYARVREVSPAGRAVARLAQVLWRGQTALGLSCSDIGPGLYVSHGFATIVVAESIGTDCLVSQQVTVGYTDAGGPPVIGDRVRIGAGAQILGPITVGHDAVIGANAVVVHDVAPGAIVGGVPARELPTAGDRFRSPLAPPR